MEILAFNSELNFKAVIDSFSSFRKVLRYNELSSFELHVSFNIEILEALSLGNVIWQKGDSEAFIIENRNITLDETGKEMLVVMGSSLTAYLDRRIVWQQEILSGTAEEVMREFVLKHAISPANADRKIPLLELGDLKGYSGQIRRQATYTNLLNVVQQVAGANELGFRTLVDLNNKRLIFDIYKGRDLSRKVVFSREFENVLSQEYTDGNSEYKNTALVAGAGEGADRKRIAIENGTGLERYELFVDAKDVRDTKDDKENTPIPENEYNEMLSEFGKDKLAERVKVESFDSKINLKGNMIYKKDFKLGDIVTVLDKKWNLEQDVRVAEVEEVYEESGLEVFVIFGEEPINIFDKLRQAVE